MIGLECMEKNPCVWPGFKKSSAKMKLNEKLSATRFG